MTPRNPPTPDDERDGDNAPDAMPTGTSRLEWAAAALGALLLLSVIAGLVLQWTSEADTPPHITFILEPPLQQGDAYLVRATAHNHGTRTAAAVHIEADLLYGPPNDRQRQTSTAELDFLPEQSSRDFGLFFTHDPSLGELRVRVTGYAEP